jgi:hypothetical protein
MLAQGGALGLTMGDNEGAGGMRMIMTERQSHPHASHEAIACAYGRSQGFTLG